MNTLDEINDLDKIQADRRLVDSLAAHGLLSAEARALSLELLYPATNWRLWIERVLLALGTALVLSGIIYFFAFNWNRIPPLVKLGSIEVGMLFCIAGSVYYGARTSGQLLLTAAAVLTGVFLAVFGQIYQTGADAYNLFVAWAVLILPWVCAAKFAPLWAIWATVTNVALLCYWIQEVQPHRTMELMIASYLALLNGLFLLGREMSVRGGAEWLSDRWTRLVPVIVILVCLGIPALIFISGVGQATESIVAGTVMCAIFHAVFLYTYRYILPDMWSLAATILSLCLLIEAAGIRVLAEGADGAGTLFLMGAFTIGLFTMATISIRKISKTVEAGNA